MMFDYIFTKIMEAKTIEDIEAIKRATEVVESLKPIQKTELTIIADLRRESLISKEIIALYEENRQLHHELMDSCADIIDSTLEMI